MDSLGIPHPVMWTRLAQTAEPGTQRLKLSKSVTWLTGMSIIISSSTSELDFEQHVISGEN